MKDNMFGLWCNGNTTGSGSVISSSNLDSPTKKIKVEIYNVSTLFFILAVSLRTAKDVVNPI